MYNLHLFGNHNFKLLVPNLQLHATAVIFNTRTYQLHAMEKNLLRVGHISVVDFAWLPHLHPWEEKGLKSSDRNIRLDCLRSSRIAS